MHSVRQRKLRDEKQLAPYERNINLVFHVLVSVPVLSTFSLYAILQIRKALASHLRPEGRLVVRHWGRCLR